MKIYTQIRWTIFVIEIFTLFFQKSKVIKLKSARWAHGNWKSACYRVPNLKFQSLERP